MSQRMTMSQDALTMYIFHPIFCNAMGMMKMKTRLQIGCIVSEPVNKKRQRGGGEAFLSFFSSRRTHARLLSVNWEKATPLARIE